MSFAPRNQKACQTVYANDIIDTECPVSVFKIHLSPQVICGPLPLEKARDSLMTLSQIDVAFLCGIPWIPPGRGAFLVGNILHISSHIESERIKWAIKFYWRKVP